MRELSVSVDGGHLYVRVAGSGPPLILVHGWPLDHRLFCRQVPALEQFLTVVTYDRRGFGRSDAPANLGREPEDIDRLIDALGFESAHLLGMSQGGRIALRYAATHPERVRSLILQGAAVDGVDVAADDEDRVPVEEYVALAQSGRLDEVKRRWLEHPMMRLPSTDTDATQLIAEIMADYDGADLMGYEPGAYAFPDDVLSRMARFERPLLVISGAMETASRHAHAAELLNRVPNGLEVVLERSGHLANLTEPDAYNRAVLDFVLASDPA